MGSSRPCARPYPARGPAAARLSAGRDPQRTIRTWRSLPPSCHTNARFELAICQRRVFYVAYKEMLMIITHVEALNLRHLRAWITVVDEGTVSGGARKLGVSQPALSQQLRALEEFFGD